MEAAQSSKQAQLALFQEEQKRVEEDIHVPLRLKQGQVEIQPQGIVDSSMEDAVLVALQLVQVGYGARAWGLGGEGVLGVCGTKAVGLGPTSSSSRKLFATYNQLGIHACMHDEPRDVEAKARCRSGSGALQRKLWP